MSDTLEYKSPAMMKLVMSQMFLDGVSPFTVKFFQRGYKLLSDPTGVSCKELAYSAGLTSQAAARHLHKMVELGYLQRLNYRAWCLSDDPIKDSDLRMMKKLILINKGLFQQHVH